MSLIEVVDDFTIEALTLSVASLMEKVHGGGGGVVGVSSGLLTLFLQLQLQENTNPNMHKMVRNTFDFCLLILKTLFV